MHVVSYKAAYNNYTNALNYVDGVAVLASFFEVHMKKKSKEK